MHLPSHPVLLGRQQTDLCLELVLLHPSTHVARFGGHGRGAHETIYDEPGATKAAAFRKNRGLVAMERLGHKVHKGPHPRGRFVLGRIHRVNVGVRRVVLRQQLHQLALRQVLANVPFGAHQDAVPVQRPLHGDAAVVGGQVATGFDGLGFAAAPARELDHAIGFVALADADEVVPCQVGRGFGLAVARDVGGRCAKQALVAGDLAGDHPGVRGRAEADAHIKGIVTQRGWVHRQLQLHIDLRVLLHKAADQRTDVAAAKAQGGVHAQQAAGRGSAGSELLFQIGHFGQDAAGVSQHGFTFHRQAHAPRGAVEQGHTQAGFHLRQAFADGCRGDAHLAGGGAQAAGHGQCRKKAQISGLQARFHC